MSRSCGGGVPTSRLLPRTSTRAVLHWVTLTCSERAVPHYVSSQNTTCWKSKGEHQARQNRYKHETRSLLVFLAP